MMGMLDSFVIVKRCEYPSKEIHEADDDPCQAKESDGRSDPHLAAEDPEAELALHSGLELVRHVGIFSLFFRKNTTYTVVGTRPELRLSFQCS